MIGPAAKAKNYLISCQSDEECWLRLETVTAWKSKLEIPKLKLVSFHKTKTDKSMHKD